MLLLSSCTKKNVNFTGWVPEYAVTASIWTMLVEFMGWEGEENIYIRPNW